MHSVKFFMSWGIPMIKKLKNFFLDYINWCHPTYSNGEEKKVTWFYTFWCWCFWPIPWMDDPCWCCASVRGMMYGFVMGLVAAWLWGLV